ncbi:DUF4430 domain-containing protein [Ethanoligenens sp.]|uniref:DUF4430 domain-containing protein n=1 Tax=Ethanoligenens sp. TaxID=2099655 RepID=UPI0039E72D70
MKKVFQGWISVCCAFALLFVSIPGLSAAADAQNTFHLCVEGSSQTVLNEDVPLTAGETLQTALEKALNQNNISYQLSDSQYGKYIATIGSDTQAADYSTYWSIYQNGAYAQLGVSSLQPANGDNIIIAFTASDTLYPIVTVSPSTPSASNPFTVTLTAQKTTYDAQWNPTTSTVPVADATVTFNGTSKTTDTSGNATFTAPANAGSYAYQVKKDRSGQAPALVRMSGSVTVSASSSSSSSSSQSSSSSSSSSQSSSGGNVSTVTSAAVASASKSAADALKDDTSDWTAFALARAGYPIPSTYLSETTSAIAENIDTFKALNFAKYILVLRAAGADPTNINGINLVDNLYKQTNVGLTGLNGYIFTLLALSSADYTPPANAAVSKTALVTSILSAQNTDGSFSLAAGLSGDVDITSMVLTALAPYASKITGVQDTINKGLAYLAANEQADGGFIPGGASTEASESTSQVIIALSSLGIDPATSTQFVKNGKSPLSNLLSFSVQGGGFSHDASGEVDTIATQQALDALTAYQRFEANQNTLYDLRDAQSQTPSSSSSNTSTSASGPVASADSSSATASSTTSTVTNGTSVANPYTGDSEPVGGIVAISLAATAILLFTRRRKH